MTDPATTQNSRSEALISTLRAIGLSLRGIAEGPDNILRIEVSATSEALAELTHPVGGAMAEIVARAMALRDGLDFDEICGHETDPEEGCCDSGTCIAVHWEDHDADQARRWYLDLARAAIETYETLREGARTVESATP